MSTYSNAYQVFTITYYPSAPNASMLQSSAAVAALTQAAAVAALIALFPSAVIQSVTPDTDGTTPVNLPAAVTGTTSPANLYSVDFYPSAPTGSIGSAGTSSFQVEQNNVIAQNMQVIANTPAQAWAVVLNYFASAVQISIGSVTEDVSALAVQLT